MKLIPLLICIVVFFLFHSCTSRSVEPTRASRHTIDTLYQQKIIVLKPEMDSLCANLKQTVYHEAVDSLMRARNVEMEILVE